MAETQHITVNFKPSEVQLFKSPLPLENMFGGTALETAAAMMVLTCKDLGDTWQPVNPLQMAAAMNVETEKGGALRHLVGHPRAVGPDFHSLVQAGYAESSLADMDPIQFTQKGFDVLRTVVVLPS